MNQYKDIYNKLERKADKINFLTGLLSSSVSPVGDWKVIKCYEARMNKQEDPYDFTALTTARQQVRDEINAVQALPDDEENIGG